MRVWNKTEHIKHIGPVTLNIGANEIDEKDWSRVEKHPIVKHLTSKGLIKAEEGNLENVADITPADKAIELVESTFSQEKLQKWLETETRKGVKAAIEKQIESLNPSQEDDE